MYDDGGDVRYGDGCDGDAGLLNFPALECAYVFHWQQSE